MSRTKNRYGEIIKSDTRKVREEYVGIYARVSVDNKTDSINNQILIAKQYIDNICGAKLIDIYVDEGISGYTMERKQFRRLMNDIGNRRINCVVVKDISRLGRNHLSISKLLEYDMVEKGVRIIAVNDCYDSANNDCNKIKSIILQNIINEMYVKDTGYKIKKSKQYLKEKGAYIGVYAPYGYKIENVDGLRSLVIDEKSMRIVMKMIHMREMGKTYTFISDYLYKECINTKLDYIKSKCIYQYDIKKLKKWTVKSVKETIENAYIHIR